MRELVIKQKKLRTASSIQKDLHDSAQFQTEDFSVCKINVTKCDPLAEINVVFPCFWGREACIKVVNGINTFTIETQMTTYKTITVIDTTFRALGEVSLKSLYKI